MQVSIVGAGGVAYSYAAVLAERGHQPRIWSPSGRRGAELAAGAPLQASTANAVPPTQAPVTHTQTHAHARCNDIRNEYVSLLVLDSRTLARVLRVACFLSCTHHSSTTALATCSLAPIIEFEYKHCMRVAS